MKNPKRTGRRALRRSVAAVATVDRLAQESIENSTPRPKAPEPSPETLGVPDPIPIIHVDELPLFERGSNGDVHNGFMIDYWFYASEKQLLISGWILGERNLESLQDKNVTPGLKVRVFPRPDVEEAFPTLRSSCRGVLAIVAVDNDTFEIFGLSLWLPPRSPNNGDRLWADHAQRLGFILQHCSEETAIFAGLAAQLKPDRGVVRARGHFEQLKGAPGHGGLIVGWSVALPGVKLGLIDMNGHFELLNHAIRWHRPDIADGFGLEFGNFSFNAGFLQAWHHPLEIGQEIRLIALSGDDCHVLASSTWQAAPIEPTSFARWAFDLPTPLDRFFERLDRHDGRIIQSLIASKLAARTSVTPEIISLGEPLDNPRCSIIVPLYGRFDFMMNQLLEFSEDELLKIAAEIIYVIDDPRIATDVKRQAWLLYEANRVSFKIVYSRENRGFSGANNLGVMTSRAPLVVLLNSDVIPVEPGWLNKMLAALENRDDVGIVGARLHYPNGSIQHNGICFVWQPELNAHINKHPGIGLELPAPHKYPTPRIAVTGACLMMRKATYLDVGGLDETFLIGDFEDSDLCLKIRQAGQSIVCVEDVQLVHLERQSFVGIGQNHYRDLVVRFNAWQHEKRWASVLRSLDDGN